LCFDYQGKEVKLQGIQENLTVEKEVTLNQLTAMEKSSDIWALVQVYPDESLPTTEPPPLPPKVS
jgi:hypothetical protein